MLLGSDIRKFFSGYVYRRIDLISTDNTID